MSKSFLGQEQKFETDFKTFNENNGIFLQPKSSEKVFFEEKYNLTNGKHLAVIESLIIDFHDLEEGVLNDKAFTPQFLKNQLEANKNLKVQYKLIKNDYSVMIDKYNKLKEKAKSNISVTFNDDLVNKQESKKKLELRNKELISEIRTIQSRITKTRDHVLSIVSKSPSPIK